MPGETRNGDQGQDFAATAEAIAKELGETEGTPLRQLRRLVRSCGAEMARSLLRHALEVEAAGGLFVKNGGRRRTLGGVFFRLARNQLYPSDRASYYRVFGPAPIKRSRPSWDDRPRGPGEPFPGGSEVRSVNINIVGRPEQISRGNGYVVLSMSSRKAPSLPRGLPSPGPVATRYAVYITDKQWRRVESALKDPADALIVDGYPHLDGDERVIAVLAGRVTTRALEAAARK